MEQQLSCNLRDTPLMLECLGLSSNSALSSDFLLIYVLGDSKWVAVVGPCHLVDDLDRVLDSWGLD